MALEDFQNHDNCSLIFLVLENIYQSVTHAQKIHLKVR
jgi:hypothetical protein